MDKSAELVCNRFWVRKPPWSLLVHASGWECDWECDSAARVVWMMVVVEMMVVQREWWSGGDDGGGVVEMMVVVQ